MLPCDVDAMGVNIPSGTCLGYYTHAEPACCLPPFLPRSRAPVGSSGDKTLFGHVDLLSKDARVRLHSIKPTRAPTGLVRSPPSFFLCSSTRYWPPRSTEHSLRREDRRSDGQGKDSSTRPASKSEYTPEQAKISLYVLTRVATPSSRCLLKEHARWVHF